MEAIFEGKMRESRAYVSVGSNLGDRAANLLLAVRGMLEAGLPVSRLSRIYETDPVDYLDQPSFMNMVVELRGTMPPPDQVLARLLKVEYQLGRRRDIKQGPRTVDLDLLLFDSVESDSEFLTLPHPRMHLRRFVLEPLSELAGQAIHPGSGKTIDQLLKEVDDSSRVLPLSPSG
jgi:2-amino-4-hydroxy-6-hydroxymethyldihydropteridine diphosphokinase